jgi:predicted metalloprotease
MVRLWCSFLVSYYSFDVTQNWGVPNQGQQWPTSQGWNRQPNAWGPPTTPTQFPPQAPPVPPGTFGPVGAFGAPQQPPGYPQQYGQPGSFPPPRAPRKNPLLAVIGGGVFLLILGFFMIALVNYLNGDTPGQPGNDPTYHQVTNVPAPDYSPPTVPAPNSYEQATTWMQKNAIYNQSVPVPTNCTVPYIDSTTASTADLEKHLNQLTACLWGVWEGPTTTASFKLPRPPATVFTTDITTPCGKTGTGNAFYCAADQHIYYAQDLYRILPTSVRKKPFVTEAIMAHEFGHAIQARTGILIAEKAWEQKDSAAEARILSRRTEMQADCFAGLWVDAVAKASNLTSSDLDSLKFLFFNIGDDVLAGDANYDGDHGLSKNRQAWLITGLGNSQIGKCDTYTAAASQVR